MIAAHTQEGKGFFGSCSDAIKEPVAHHPVAAMKANFNVLFGQVQNMRSFRRAQFLDITQHHDRSILLRQIKHGLLKESSELGVGCSPFGIGRLAGILHRDFSIKISNVHLLVAQT